MGFDVSGIEPGAAGVKFAKDNYGISLQEGFDSTIDFTKQYDVIVARHVLEHINQPDECLKKIINKGLKPGGILMLKLPRLDSWEAKLFKVYWDGFDLPRHRVHFTESGITQLLKKLGFIDIKIRIEAVPTSIMRSLKYYNKFGPSRLGKFFTKILTVIPNLLQYAIYQLVALTLSPLRPGRMIVTGRKPHKNV